MKIAFLKKVSLVFETLGVSSRASEGIRLFFMEVAG
jgi:hypothetical protein